MLINTDKQQYEAAPQQLLQNGKRVQKFKIGNRTAMTGLAREVPSRSAS